MYTTPSVSSPDRGFDALDLRCPPLPNTLLQAIELTHQPEGPSLEQVVEMVQHDPAVTARLLRVVNSAFYGQRGRVTNIHRAVVVLGPSGVVGIILSMSLLEMRSALDATTAMPFMNLVRHSVAAAFLAQRLVACAASGTEDAAARREHGSEVFTAGILHDFGKLILLYNFPEKAAHLYRKPRRSSPALLLQAEKDLLGYDHVETGAFLARRLTFPEAAADAITFHHSEAQLEEAGAQHAAWLVAAASRAANALGYVLNHEVSQEACHLDPIWQRMVDLKVIGYPDAQAMLAVVEAARPDVAAYVDAIF